MVTSSRISVCSITGVTSATSAFEVETSGRVLILLLGADNSEVDESVIADPVFQPSFAASGNSSFIIIHALGAWIAFRSSFSMARCSVVLSVDIAASPCCLVSSVYYFFYSNAFWCISRGLVQKFFKFCPT